MDLALDPTLHDIQLLEGTVRLTDGIPEAAAQRLTIHLALFLGEWFLNELAGVPYFQQVLRQVPNNEQLKSVFRREVLADPYVVAVPRITADIDRPNRSLTIKFEATLVDGSELTVLLSESLATGQIVVNTVGVFVNGIPLVVAL